MDENLFARPLELVRDSGIPAHTLIEQWLIDAISRGELTAGDKLPREQDLAACFGVSRMTLRQALGRLESRAVLKRIPGRFGGTFVIGPKIECDLTGLVGFTELMRRANVRAGARVISATTIAAPRAAAEALRLQRDDLVHRIVRVRSVGRSPLALERACFPASVFPDLLSHRLNGSLYNLMRKHYQQEPRTATDFLEPVSATADEAELLDIGPGAPLMMIERTAQTSAGLPVEFSRDLFRPDRLRVSVRSGWDARGNAASVHDAAVAD
ncbi:MAG: GntR family transcriptional regulator [Nocardioidaceae bacterium]